MIPKGQFNKTVVRKGPHQGIYFATKEAIYFGSPAIEPQEVSRISETLALHVDKTRLLAGTKNGQILGARNFILQRTGPVVGFVRGDRLYDISEFTGEYIVQHTSESSEAAWLSKTNRVYWDGKRLVSLGNKCLQDFERNPTYHFSRQPQHVIKHDNLFWRVEQNVLLDYAGKSIAEFPQDADDIALDNTGAYYLRGGKGIERLVFETKERTTLFPTYTISCFTPGVKRVKVEFT